MVSGWQLLGLVLFAGPILTLLFWGLLFHTSETWGSDLAHSGLRRGVRRYRARPLPAAWETPMTLTPAQAREIRRWQARQERARVDEKHAS